MGRHRHTKDRMFITQTEHKLCGGGKNLDQKLPMTILPYFCCSLGLQPFENPVCSPEGIVFDLINIIPFIKKYKKNPVNGETLKVNDLIKLNFHKNEKNEFHDPVSFKTFTDYTYIVAIKTSGNVYSYDTIEELNKKPKYYKDLLTQEPFTIKDIITIQNPKIIENRTVKDFYYIKSDLQFEPLKKKEDISQYINQNDLTKKVLSELQKSKQEEQKKQGDKIQEEKQEIEQIIKKQKQETSVNEYLEYCEKCNIFKHERETTAAASISVTSTGSDPLTSGAIQYRYLNKEEVRQKIYSEIKGKKLIGSVILKTNFGNIGFLLHCNYAPKTCENFIELCETKYYNNTKFHRLISNFMVQGGDPSSTGKGGKSIFGTNFEDEFNLKLSHDKEGILSMANSGPNTNGSQFFITFDKCLHLDGKHTVFGELISGIQNLRRIKDVPTNNKDVPLKDILIEEVIVQKNPYREVIQQFKEKQKQDKRNENQELQKFKQQDRWLQCNKANILKDYLDFNDNNNENNELENQKEKQKSDKLLNKPKMLRAGIIDQILNSEPLEIKKQNDSCQNMQFNFSQW